MQLFLGEQTTPQVSVSNEAELSSSSSQVIQESYESVGEAPTDLLVDDDSDNSTVYEESNTDHIQETQMSSHLVIPETQISSTHHKTSFPSPIAPQEDDCNLEQYYNEIDFTNDRRVSESVANSHHTQYIEETQAYQPLDETHHHIEETQNR